MTEFVLSQGWTKKPLNNLSVKGSFEKHSSYLSIRIEVMEPTVKALLSGYNKEVFKDSCVEIFISLDGKNYYNFEINCIGAILGQHGMGRFDRMFIDENILNKINIFSSLGYSPIGIIPRPYSYTIEIDIPKEALIFDSQNNFDNIIGNIYKCADESPTPHYMYYYPVKTEKPDFHRPEFFGKL